MLFNRRTALAGAVALAATPAKALMPMGNFSSAAA